MAILFTLLVYQIAVTAFPANECPYESNHASPNELFTQDAACLEVHRKQSNYRYLVAIVLALIAFGIAITLTQRHIQPVLANSLLAGACLTIFISANSNWNWLSDLTRLLTLSLSFIVGVTLIVTRMN